jgi:glutamate racemase
MVDQALGSRSDVIVLGCTHYHWIEEDIAKLVKKKATILQPEPAVIKRLGLVIEQLT